MKNKARDAKTLQNQLKRTGGGPPEEPMSNTDIQVLSAIPSLMATVKVPIDSDGVCSQGIFICIRCTYLNSSSITICLIVTITAYESLYNKIPN